MLQYVQYFLMVKKHYNYPCKEGTSIGQSWTVVHLGKEWAVL